MKRTNGKIAGRNGSRTAGRRILYLALALGLGGAAVAALRPDSVEASTVTVYKSPTCGCCTKWVSYLEREGFETQVVSTTDLAGVQAEHGVPHELGSCHTAVVDGYVLEGHVPAADIKRLLRERPAVVGLAVPGMPAGSPGMEGAVRQRYDVLAFQKDGAVAVFAQR